MGLEYRLNCYKCHDASLWIEFSVCSEYHVKTIPDDVDKMLRSWVPFLFKHNGHGVDLIDHKGKRTDPTKITGAYVLGLEDP